MEGECKYEVPKNHPINAFKSIADKFEYLDDFMQMRRIFLKSEYKSEIKVFFEMLFKEVLTEQ